MNTLCLLGHRLDVAGVCCASGSGERLCSPWNVRFAVCAICAFRVRHLFKRNALNGIFDFENGDTIANLKTKHSARSWWLCRYARRRVLPVPKISKFNGVFTIAEVSWVRTNARIHQHSKSEWVEHNVRKPKSAKQTWVGNIVAGLSWVFEKQQ